MKPAIFNTEMVRVILDGRKTQTRRAKGVPLSHHTLYQQRINADGYLIATFDGSITIKSEYKVGDIIYVRETWNHTANESDLLDHEPRNKIGGRFIVYRADGEQIHPIHGKSIWKPSIHMPKEYARLFLRVKDIRIERLNEISADDACKEGLDWKDYWCDNGQSINDPREWFKSLWESIYGNGSFDNRYVWVTEFEKISKEEAINETAT